MHSPYRRLLAASIVVLAAVAPMSGAWLDQSSTGDGALQQPGKDAPAGSAQAEKELERVGQETVDRVCTSCHTFEDITRMRLGARDWNDVITDMVTRGATGTDAELATVKRYLTRYFGRVSVNAASAEELSAVLGLSSKDANAIVEYRKAHGRFADAAALGKVPGIDKTKIDEAQPGVLRFN